MLLLLIKQDACSGVHSACREENRHKVGVRVKRGNGKTETEKREKG